MLGSYMRCLCTHMHRIHYVSAVDAPSLLVTHLVSCAFPAPRRPRVERGKHEYRLVYARCTRNCTCIDAETEEAT